MARETKSISTLKRYTRVIPSTADDHIATYQELDGESDRAAIILAATALEDHFERAVRDRMIPHEETDDIYKLLFGGQGPLSSFSAKINFARALGLISERAWEEAHIIREMRNACAHSRRSISLDTKELFTVFQLLLREEPALVPLRNDESDHPQAKRHSFVGKCLILQMELGLQRRASSPGDLLDMMREFREADEPHPSPDTHFPPPNLRDPLPPKD